MNIAIMQLFLVDTSLLIPLYVSRPVLRCIWQHSLRLFSQKARSKSPLMIIKIFLILGFRQVSECALLDLCSFPVILWEYVCWCLAVPIVPSVGCHQRRSTPKEIPSESHSPHLCIYAWTRTSDSSPVHELELPCFLPHQQKEVGTFRAQLISPGFFWPLLWHNGLCRGNACSCLLAKHGL